MNLIKNAILASLLAAGTLAFGWGEEYRQPKSGFYVEPGITYETAGTSLDWPSPFNTSSGNVKGFGVYGRVGFHIDEMFFVAADARYSMPKFTDSSVGYDAQAKAYQIAPVVGIQMPEIGLRVYGSYIPYAELDPDASGNYDVKFSNGKGFRVGAGFRVSAFSINLEYQELGYGTMTAQSIGSFNPGSDFTSVKLHQNTWVASFSFPLEL